MPARHTPRKLQLSVLLTDFLTLAILFTAVLAFQ